MYTKCKKIINTSISLYNFISCNNVMEIITYHKIIDIIIRSTKKPRLETEIKSSREEFENVLNFIDCKKTIAMKILTCLKLEKNCIV